MEAKEGTLESVIDRVESLGKITYELSILKAVDKTSQVISVTVSFIIGLLLIVMSVVMANIGVAIWLGELLGSTYLGFFCVAGFYALLAIVLYSVGDVWVKKAVSNSVIRHALN